MLADGLDGGNTLDGEVFGFPIIHPIPLAALGEKIVADINKIEKPGAATGSSRIFVYAMP